ncbi:MAG: Fe-S cluster assembly protein SufD [Candidatus Bruticola sp.]
MIINLEAQFEQAMENTVQLAESCQEPQWAVDIRKASLVSARTLSIPSKEEEAWRRSAPSWFYPDKSQAIRLLKENLLIDEFLMTSEVASSLHEYGINSTTENLESATSNLSAAKKSFEKYDCAGIRIMSMSQALQTEEELKNLFFKAEHHQKELSTALNGALRTGGAYVKITPETQKERAFHIIHEINDSSSAENDQDEVQNCHFSHSLITANGPGRASIVESFTNKDTQKVKVHSLIEFDLANGAAVTYVLAGLWNKDAAVLTTIHARLGKDASLKIVYAGLGEGLSKTFFSEDLNSSGARTEIYGVVLANGRSRSDVDTFVHHKAPYTFSNVLFNCAVSDRAQSVFAGNIYVDQIAQHTDAYQKNQNLMLSSKARAESMPKLEIIADDVRCTHGASFTNYDEEQLFYMQSRGLSKAAAQSMITAGFFQEIVEKSDNSSVADWLSGTAAARFSVNN